MTLSSLNLTINNMPHPFYFRDSSLGDKDVIQQIFVNKDYELDAFKQKPALIRYYHSLLKAGQEPLIIDAGAHIGVSVVWFWAQFPEVHIVAIEPEPKNYELLVRNCEGLNVSLRQGGIAAHAGQMYLQDPGYGDWGFRLRQSGSTPVSVFAASEVVREATAGNRRPFLCKIDIEGGEAELFSEDTAWVAEFPLLIIELHDWLLPGTASSRNFLRTLSALNFDFLVKGENVFCFNNDLLR